MFKVALLMLGKGEAQNQVASGLRVIADYMSPRKCQIDEFVSEDASEDSVRRMIRKLLPLGHDLFVTSGFTCTYLLKEALTKEGDDRAIVFTGVTDPLGRGIVTSLISRDENITGVTMQSPSGSLSLQVALRIFGLQRRYVIVSRKEFATGRVGYLVRRAPKYFEERLAEVISVSLEKGEEFRYKLGNVLSQRDVVIVPETTVFTNDIVLLRDMCEERGASFFCGESSSVPEDAICGYAGDIQCLGGIAAEMAASILSGEMSAPEMPIRDLDDVTELQFNYPALARSGISLPRDEFKFSLEDGRSYQWTLRLLYSFMMPFNSVLGNRICERLAKMRKEAGEGLECKPVPIDGLTSNEEYAQGQAEYVVDLPFPFITVLGSEMAHRVQQVMWDKKKFKPMLIMKFDDDTDGIEPAVTHREEWPEHAFVMRATLPSLEPAHWIQVVRMMRPNTESVGFLHSFNESEMPVRLQRRIEAMQRYCDKQGLRFMHSGVSGNSREFEKVCSATAADVDALFCIPDSISPDHAITLSRYCNEHDRFLLGGDFDHFSIVSATLGMNYDHLTKTIFPHLIPASWDKFPDQCEFTIDKKDFYRLLFNKELLDRKGMAVPEGLEALLDIIVVEVPADQKDDCDESGVPYLLHKPVILDETNGD